MKRLFLLSLLVIAAGAGCRPKRPLIENTKTTRWVATWIASFNTGNDSEGEMELEVVGAPGETLYMFGSHGRTSTDHFTVFVRDGEGRCDANAATLVPLDRARHTFTIGNNLFDLSFMIDDALVYSVPEAEISGGDPANIRARVANGAIAANREIDLDQSFVISGR